MRVDLSVQERSRLSSGFTEMQLRNTERYILEPADADWRPCGHRVSLLFYRSLRAPCFLPLTDSRWGQGGAVKDFVQSHTTFSWQSSPRLLEICLSAGREASDLAPWPPGWQERGRSQLGAAGTTQQPGLHCLLGAQGDGWKPSGQEDPVISIQVACHRRKCVLCPHCRGIQEP